MNIQSHQGPCDDELLTLLLVADPSIESIQSYLPKSEVLVALEGKEIVGVAVVFLDNQTAELLNLVVKENYRGKGVGKSLVEAAKGIVGNYGGKCILVGTGNSSLSQLRFYQRNGFRIVGIERDHFIGYPEPIYENGIRCIDKIILSAGI